MARQWRIEYEGALFHVMSRGNEGRGITSDDDCEVFLSVLGEMSEDIHTGLVVGTKKFAGYIKKKYMPDNPSEEIPQQKTVKDDFNILHLLKQACEILECDIEEFKNARRVSYGNKLKRDIIIYLLWKTGAYTNKEIGAHFGLGYSAVSRCVSNCNELCNTSRDFKKGYNAVKSLIMM